MPKSRVRNLAMSVDVVVRWVASDEPARDAHALVRQVVGELCGRSTNEVVVDHRCDMCGGPHGRPRVDVGGRRRALSVSIAHSGSMAVVAVAGAPVGVDVEPLDAGGGAVDLARWVRTEAVLKATGFGLTVDPSLVEVIAPSGGVPRLRSWSGPGRFPRLRIADVDTGTGHVAAVARLGRRPMRVDARPVELSPTP